MRTILLLAALLPACTDTAPPTKGDVSEDVAVSFCGDYYGRCGGGNEDPEGYDLCVAEHADCGDTCGETVTDAALEACFEAISAMSCSDIYWGELPAACVF